MHTHIRVVEFLFVYLFTFIILVHMELFMYDMKQEYNIVGFQVVRHSFQYILLNTIFPLIKMPIWSHAKFVSLHLFLGTLCANSTLFEL